MTSPSANKSDFGFVCAHGKSYQSNGINIDFEDFLHYIALYVHYYLILDIDYNLAIIPNYKSLALEQKPQKPHPWQINVAKIRWYDGGGLEWVKYLLNTVIDFR